LVRRILKRSDAPPDTILLLSRVLLESGRAPQAVFELEREVKRRPDDLNLRMVLHNAYLGTKEIDKALASAVAAAQMQPDRDDTLCAVASIHFSEGRIAEAEDWYRR